MIEDEGTDMKNLKLSEMTKGKKGEIVALRSSQSIRRRLLDMGIIRGAEFQVIRKAPLGDPIEIKINGFLLTLRLEEADQITVKPLE